MYAPELRHCLSVSKLQNGAVKADVVQFLVYCCQRVIDLEFTDPEPSHLIEGTYNPPKYGRAYYFNPSGCQIRKCHTFEIDQERSAGPDNYDDEPTAFERCRKIYPHVSGRGTTFTFFWFCPTHHHCYGFHIIAGSEGRKDPAASLYTHLESAPDDIFYDFACGLHEYTLNRESGYFKNTRMFHDVFHGYTHKCAKTYKSTRLISFDSVNSEVCEQFNSFMQCIKRSASQMSQQHFVFYLQFFIHEWNLRKERRYKQKLVVALHGAQ